MRPQSWRSHVKGMGFRIQARKPQAQGQWEQVITCPRRECRARIYVHKDDITQGTLRDLEKHARSCKTRNL